jgi:hypothetical protein
LARSTGAVAEIKVGKEFETDFWKDAEGRKLRDDIVPGEPRKTMLVPLFAAALSRRCLHDGTEVSAIHSIAVSATTDRRSAPSA